MYSILSKLCNYHFIKREREREREREDSEGVNIEREGTLRKGGQCEGGQFEKQQC